jgi:uncharacterized hydrophobic protein (TIGR00271 family)
MDQSTGVRARPGFATIIEWWRDHVGTNVDHVSVVAEVREQSRASGHYVFMTLMSAGIAVLGLLLSSPAVVIGAMLISPLMGPIMGIGFAIATFDSKALRRSALVLLLGIALAVALCSLIVLLSPLKGITSEIASRTRPNLFDFLVALFSGLAGSYAMIRGRHGTIVGVAIATAIMPPLAVVGFGLATANATVLSGSALLFFTNLMTIAVTAAVLARLYGFAGNLSPRQTWVQATLVLAVLVALAIPLGLSLKQIAWEALASREAQAALSEEFGDEAQIGQVQLDEDAKPLSLQATVFTPHYHKDAERVLARELSKTLKQPVSVKIEQFRVGDGPREAQATQVAAARSGGAAETARSRLGERLALIAGVAADQVLIDDAQAKAVVRAAALPGAGLATYRALEARVTAAEPNWTITLIPPILDPPALEGADGSDDRRHALETIAWASQRLRLPVGVRGGREAEAQRLVAAMKAAGIDARRLERPAGPLKLLWILPGAVPASQPPSPPPQ